MKFITENFAGFVKGSFENQMANPQDDMPTVDMVRAMRNQKYDFASSVAVTVCETGRMTEKQAKCLSIGIENNREGFVSFLNYCPSDVFAPKEGEYVSE